MEQPAIRARSEAAGVREHRFTVDQFLRMGEAGILHPDLRVELLDGTVYEMAAVNSPHAGCVNRLARLLIGSLGDVAVVTVQNPVHVNRYTQLLPDLAVLQPRDDFYAARNPRPQDVLLLIEVADSTLGHDRSIKMPVYGRSGIAESWLVDVNARRVEVYREPSADSAYRTRRIVAEGELVTPAALPQLTIGPGDILG